MVNSITFSKGIQIARNQAKPFWGVGLSPTSVRNMAEKVGIDRVELRSMTADAMQIPRPDGGYTVFLNAAQPKHRHRFSLAHEIAHVLLRPYTKGVVVHRRSFSPEQDPKFKQIERICNRMAAEILMPHSAFYETAEQHGWTLENTIEIASKLRVSSEAAIRRLVDLAPQPFGVIAWEASQPDWLSWKWSYSNSKIRASRISFKPGAWLSQYPSLKQTYESSQRTLGTETMILLVGSKGSQNASYQQMSCESMLVGSERFKRGYTLIRPE